MACLGMTFLSGLDGGEAQISEILLKGNDLPAGGRN
jgi:hypothetical protein